MTLNDGIHDRLELVVGRRSRLAFVPRPSSAVRPCNEMRLSDQCARDSRDRPARAAANLQLDTLDHPRQIGRGGTALDEVGQHGPTTRSDRRVPSKRLLQYWVAQHLVDPMNHMICLTPQPLIVELFLVTI